MIDKLEDKKLTAKQRKFCEEYLIDLNATQAAIRAGYSEKTAAIIGFENIRKPNIAKYIATIQLELRKKTGISAEWVVNELYLLAKSNIKAFVNGENSILELKNLDDEVTAAVSSVETTIETRMDHSSGKTQAINTNRTKIRLHDKRAALVDLGKHLGIFERDNNQKQIIIKNIGYGEEE